MNNNDYMNTLVGDHLLIAHYVKYDRLVELINREFYNSNYNEINLFIDAYSMIKSAYGLNPSQFIDKFSIASCIINACAHYRNFFWTRYKVTCKIWVVFSRMDMSIMEANSFYPGYGNIFTMKNNPEMDKVINDNMEILNMICPYIPDVQFIQSGYEPGLVFGNIISNYPNIPNIIVSKDPWNLQVVGNLPNTYMLRPAKRLGIDCSEIINNKDVITYYNFIRNNSTNIENFGIEIDGSFISFIIAATRFPERGIKSVHNLSSIYKYLCNAVKSGYINNGVTYDIDGLCNDLMKVNNVKLKSYEIGLHYNAIGFNPCMFRYCNSHMVDNINILNLHDPDSLKLINEKYFSKVPLDLMSL